MGMGTGKWGGGAVSMAVPQTLLRGADVVFAACGWRGPCPGPGEGCRRGVCRLWLAGPSSTTALALGPWPLVDATQQHWLYATNGPEHNMYRGEESNIICSDRLANGRCQVLGGAR